MQMQTLTCVILGQLCSVRLANADFRLNRQPLCSCADGPNGPANFIDQYTQMQQRSAAAVGEQPSVLPVGCMPGFFKLTLLISHLLFITEQNHVPPLLTAQMRSLLLLQTPIPRYLPCTAWYVPTMTYRCSSLDFFSNTLYKCCWIRV